jgi:phosphatidylinositol dimannoside acyltransferase
VATKGARRKLLAVQARRWATYLTYTSLAAALRNTPEFVGRGVASGVGEILMHRRGLARRMATAHLTRVLTEGTDRPVDRRELRRLTRRAFQAYARYWVEGARLPATDGRTVLDRIEWSGLENLEKGMAAGNGVIMALPHVGSWEWGGAWLALIGYPMTSVAERLEPTALFEWFIAQRGAMGLSMIPLDDGASNALIKTLRSGGLVGLLCDRDLAGNGVEVEFFGETTRLPAGPATLALRTGATLITAVVYSGPKESHRTVISAPIDTARSGTVRADIERITREIARHFEGYIRRAPEQWHLFQPNWPSDVDAERARHRS